MVKLVETVRNALAERRRLRGPAKLSYAVADRLAMLDASAWRGLTARSSVFLSHGYLSTMESALPENCLLYTSPSPRDS